MGIRLKRLGPRLHHLREVRRRRRHLAGQLLSGGGLRRPLAPLLVLVRAEPVVEPHLRHPARDPRLPRALHRPVRRPPPRPHRDAIVEARWDGDAQQWELTAESGERFRADVVVSGLGMLNVPHVPDIPGADRFRGRAFHSSRWDHTRSLAGERVASIGTGASAIQYVPAIADEAEHVTVFQRTPIWITPRLDEAFTPEQQRRFARVPFAARWHRHEDLAAVRAGPVRGGRRADRDADRAGPFVPRPQDRGPRPPGAAHARLPGRVQAAADLTRTGSRP